MSKKADTKKADKTKAERTLIRARTPMDWDGLLKTARDSHWRRLRVEIQCREWLLAGKPASLDAANAMLKARGLEDLMEAASDIENPVERAAAGEQIAQQEGLCEFSRRTGMDGIWIPANNIKAGLKENWSVLGLRMSVRGSRGALAEGMFVSGVPDPDWVSLGSAPDGVHTAVAHTTGPSGPVSSIKRHEYVNRARIKFDVLIASATAVADKISDDELAKTLVHFQEHGLGACRSQGFGKFDVVCVEEIAA